MGLSSEVGDLASEDSLKNRRGRDGVKDSGSGVGGVGMLDMDLGDCEMAWLRALE